MIISNFSIKQIGILSLIGYFIFWLWFPLLPHYNQAPLADVHTFSPALWLGLIYGFMLIALFGLYILGARQISKMSKPPKLTLLLATAVILALPLIFTYPVNANDIFRYVIRGRIQTVYAANPYTDAPTAFPNDPLLALAGEWAGNTSPYGPVWEMISGGVTAVSSGNLLAGLLLFKGIGLLAHLLTAVLIYKTASHNKLKLAYLWAFNPALLLIFVANGHNDSLMIFWLSLGLLVIRKGGNLPGILLMAVAALTKPIAVLALPLIFIETVRIRSTQSIRESIPRRSWNEGVGLAVFAVVGSLALAWLAFLPYGSPFALAQRLLQEANAGAGFSPLTLLLLLAQKANIRLSLTIVANVALSIFGIYSLWLMWRVWNGRSALKSTANIFTAYLLQALNFRIWYAAWPFLWQQISVNSEQISANSHQLTVNSDRLSVSSRQLAGNYYFWFLLTSQLSVIIYSHLRIYLLGGDQLLAHLLGIPFTFLLPLWLARKNRDWELGI